MPTDLSFAPPSKQTKEEGGKFFTRNLDDTGERLRERHRPPSLASWAARRWRPDYGAPRQRLQATSAAGLEESWGL